MRSVPDPKIGVCPTSEQYLTRSHSQSDDDIDDVFVVRRCHGDGDALNSVQRISGTMKVHPSPFTIAMPAAMASIDNNTELL